MSAIGAVNPLPMLCGVSAVDMIILSSVDFEDKFDCKKQQSPKWVSRPIAILSFEDPAS